MIKPFITAITFVSTVFISGCGTTTSAKDDIIPPSEFTSEEIYEMHTRGANGSNEHERYMINKRYANQEEILTRPYDMLDVNKPVFNKLPNPTLYIYFPARLSEKDRLPIPAWMTEFNMYDRDEYAQHGEVSLEISK